MAPSDHDQASVSAVTTDRALPKIAEAPDRRLQLEDVAAQFLDRGLLIQARAEQLSTTLSRTS